MIHAFVSALQGRILAVDSLIQRADEFKVWEAVSQELSLADVPISAPTVSVEEYCGLATECQTRKILPI